MTTKNLTTGQKLDLLLKKVTVLDEKVGLLDGKVDVLEGKVDLLDEKVGLLDGKVDVLEGKVDLLDGKVDVLDGKVDKMQNDITDLIELTSSAMNLAAVTSDRVDKLEGKKSPARIATQSVAGGFTHFTSGAFVA